MTSSSRREGGREGGPLTLDPVIFLQLVQDVHLHLGREGRREGGREGRGEGSE